jgi:hypothetical protein
MPASAAGRGDTYINISVDARDARDLFTVQQTNVTGNNNVTGSAQGQSSQSGLHGGPSVADDKSKPDNGTPVAGKVTAKARGKSTQRNMRAQGGDIDIDAEDGSLQENFSTSAPPKKAKKTAWWKRHLNKLVAGAIATALAFAGWYAKHLVEEHDKAEKAQKAPADNHQGTP